MNLIKRWSAAFRVLVEGSDLDVTDVDRLADLLDVLTINPQVGDALKFNGTKWVNDPVFNGGTIAGPLKINTVNEGDIALELTPDQTAVNDVQDIIRVHNGQGGFVLVVDAVGDIASYLDADQSGHFSVCLTHGNTI